MGESHPCDWMNRRSSFRTVIGVEAEADGSKKGEDVVVSEAFQSVLRLGFIPRFQVEKEHYVSALTTLPPSPSMKIGAHTI